MHEIKPRRDDYDIIVNKNVRSTRTKNGMTQGELAKKIGVTVQQIQKYEKCINRISCGKLAVIAKALNQPVWVFYESIDQEICNPKGSEIDEKLTQDLISVKMFKYFQKLPKNQKRLLVELTKTMAKEPNEGEGE